MTTSTATGHLASFASYAIFGLNIVMCKDIANSDILSPYGLFLLRALGATLLFWVSSLFIREEKIPWKDMLHILCASFVGLLLPQLTFLVGIREASSIDSSLISTLSPIFTMFFAAYFIKEPVTWKKAAGVVISFAGVTFLILNSLYHKGSASTQTTPTGMILLFANCLTFALYLGAFKPLIARYHVITFMKWMFLFTLVMSIPFCLSDTVSFTTYVLSRPAITPQLTAIIWEIAYVVVFATFLAYLLIPIGQKRIRPTLVSMYSYIQPVIAVVISVIIGMDHLTWIKDLAIIMIFLGVAIVNQSRTIPHATPYRDLQQ